MIKIHSTKKFVNMPCAHAQWFDTEPDGSIGECASIHGYDRSVHLTFSGTIDEHGWLIPFGELGKVKEFLEYYFDHTTVLPADDPRIDFDKTDMFDSTLFGTLRILPYGVSMEMSSMFIWEHVDPYIRFITNGRAYVSKVESIEHERNSAFFEADEEASRSYYRRHRLQHRVLKDYLPKKATWMLETPADAVKRISGI